MKQIGTVTDTVTSMERCPFCGARLVMRFDHNPRRVISLSGEYWIREHVQRCSNKDCKGFKTFIFQIRRIAAKFIKSVENLLPGVPHQYCQQHFLTNAGGFMEDDYRELGKIIK